MKAMLHPLNLLFWMVGATLFASAAKGADQPTPAPAPAVVREEGGATYVRFSDPAKPGTLRLRLVKGDIEVVGGDGTEVVIKSDLRSKNMHERRSDGLRRLDDDVTYGITEQDNVITVELQGDSPAAGGSDMNITVPRRTSVVIENSFGGETDVRNLIGNVEICSMNGEVTLSKIEGSAIVETMNGEITADFTKITEGKPISFTTMNGEIDVRVPADTKANVRLRTQSGAILTDFDEKMLVTKTEAASGHFVPKQKWKTTGTSGEISEAVREATRAGMEAAQEAIEIAREAAEAAREGLAEARGTGIPRPPRPPRVPSIGSASGGKVVSGILNGGGADLQIATMHGSITLRKAKP